MCIVIYKNSYGRDCVHQMKIIKIQSVSRDIRQLFLVGSWTRGHRR